MKNRRICSKCGSTNIAEYVYGLPSDEALKKKNPNIIWAGCLIRPNRPHYHCKDCGTDFYEDMTEWEEKQEQDIHVIKTAPKSKSEIFLNHYTDLIGVFIILLIFSLFDPSFLKSLLLVLGYFAFIWLISSVFE